MLQIKQKHIILGLPIHLSWEIRTRSRFCLLYFPVTHVLFFWKNWKLIKSKGELEINTHNLFSSPSKDKTQQRLLFRIYALKWFRVKLKDELSICLDATFVELKGKPKFTFIEKEFSAIEANIHEVQSPQLNLKEPVFSSMKIVPKNMDVKLKNTDINLDLIQ